MSRETKMMKVYAEDWSFLNQVLGFLQSHRKERLSFADALHFVLELWGKEVGKGLSEWITQVWEHLPQEFKEELEKSVQ